MVKIRYIILFIMLFFTFTSWAEVNRYLVFFTDKDGNTYDIQQPEEFLSDRALQRRSKQNISISINDLPVSDSYLNELSNLVNVYFSTKWMNGVLVEMDESEIEEIGSLNFVDSVLYVAKGSKLSDSDSNGRKSGKFKSNASDYDGVESSGQNEFIGVDDMHNLGFHGEEMLIAIFDSGFDHVDQSSFYSHVFDEKLISGSRDFIRGSDNVFQYDVHGSKVLSCISALKEGVYSGTAPESNIVLCVTEDIQSEYMIEEFNWLFAAEYADSIGVDVINSSVGYSYFDDDRMNYTYEDLDGNTTVITRAADWAASKGMLVVCSNGNEGNNSWEYMNAPADADSVLSIGAATYDLERSNFSSFGPTSDGRIKPDVAALGSWVKVALKEEISYANGTSFSSPMVAGLAAGLWQAYPQLSNIEVIEYIKMTASQSDSPDTLLGFGIANFIKAFNKVKLNESDVVEKFIVFPNPVTNKRIIYFYTDSLVDEQKANLSFHDLKGSYIQTEDLGIPKSNDLIEVDVSFLKPGSYILTYVNGSVAKKSKLVVL